MVSNAELISPSVAARNTRTGSFMACDACSKSFICSGNRWLLGLSKTPIVAACGTSSRNSPIRLASANPV